MSGYQSFPLHGPPLAVYMIPFELPRADDPITAKVPLETLPAGLSIP